MTEQEAIEIWNQSGKGRTFWTFDFAQAVERKTVEKALAILGKYGLSNDQTAKELRGLTTEESTSANVAQGAEAKLEFMPVDSMQHAIVYGSTEAIGALKARMERDYRVALEPAAPADPCPQCVPGGVCKTPTCGRLRAAPSTAAQRQPGAIALTEDQIAKIAHYCETEAHASPGTNMWMCAHMAVEETLRVLAEPYLHLQIAEVCEDADGHKHIEAVIEDLDDLPKGMELFAAPPAHAALTDAARDVLAERQRQVTAEGWTPEHDDEHTESEMALAAACYAMAAGGYAKGQTPPIWPWSLSWWKPAYGRRDLIKAAALILAEIERRDRRALTAAQSASGDTK